MSVLIYTDTINGKPKKSSLEAIHYGSKVAQLLGTNAVALVVNSNENLAELGKYGASKVLKITNDKLNSFDPQLLTTAIAQAANSAGAKVVVFAHDSSGKSLASRLSARSKAGLVSGATSLPTVDGGNFTVRKNVFSGKAFTDINILTDEKIISLMPNSFPVVATDASAEVADFAADLSGVTSTLVVKEVNRASATGVAPLPEAELVVSAGRGMKGPEHWGLIEDLAKSIGATTACSRPVSDIGWRPHHEHVGQTGLAIRPNLYIAIGISGAIQHLAGVNQSKVIVVINKDPEAPFFKAADYGIVGDAFEIVPKLTEAFKNFKASHN